MFSPCYDTRIFRSIHIKAYAAFRFRFKILSTKIVPLKIKRLDFFVLNICSVFICEGLKVFSTANHHFFLDKWEQHVCNQISSGSVPSLHCVYWNIVQIQCLFSHCKANGGEEWTKIVDVTCTMFLFIRFSYFN